MLKPTMSFAVLLCALTTAVLVSGPTVAQQPGGLNSKTSSGAAPAAAVTAPAALRPVAPQPAPGTPLDRDGKPLNLASFALRVMTQWDAATPLRLWPAGSTIGSCFMGGTSADRALVVDAAKAWMAHANIVFAFGAAPSYNTCAPNPVSKPNLRVLLNTDKTKADSYASLGTEGMGKPIELHTMAVSLVSAEGKRREDKMIRRTAIHELGHVLGVQHTHQHPDAKCFDLTNWKSACVIWPEFKKHPEPARMAGYTSVNLAPRLRIPGIEPDRYDAQSIMHYRFPKANFSSVTPACVGEQPLELSPGDKRLIAGLYPKDPAVQQRMILDRGLQLGRHIANIRGLTEIEAKALVRYAELMVRRSQPNLPFKVDITGFQARGRLEFAGATWSTVDKLQYGRGIEAPDKCGVTAKPVAARPALATQPSITTGPTVTPGPTVKTGPTIAVAAPKPARRTIELQKPK